MATGQADDASGRNGCGRRASGRCRGGSVGERIGAVAQQDAGAGQARASPHSVGPRSVVAGEGIVEAAERERPDRAPPHWRARARRRRRAPRAPRRRRANDRDCRAPRWCRAAARRPASGATASAERIMAGRDPLVADEIAGDQHEVGPQRVDLGDDPREPLGRHVRPGDVQVGDQHRRASAARPPASRASATSASRTTGSAIARPIAPAEQQPGRAQPRSSRKRLTRHDACVAPRLAKEKPGHARFLPAARRARLHALAQRQAEADRRLSEAHARSRPRLCAGGADRRARTCRRSSRRRSGRSPRNGSIRCCST